MASMEYRYSPKLGALNDPFASGISPLSFFPPRRVNTDLHRPEDEGWAASYHAGAAMSKWPNSGEPDETGFALAHGKGLYDYLSEHPKSLYVQCHHV